MNILNILGIVPANQKNGAVGQEASPSPQPQSLFLPMLLQFFSGNAAKTETLSFLQTPMNEKALLANEGRQHANTVTNRQGENDDSADTGLAFLTNGIARFGSLFATPQNIKFADGANKAALSPGVMGQVDSKGISITQVLGENGDNAISTPMIEDTVVSASKGAVWEPTSSVERASANVDSSTVDVSTSNADASGSIPCIGISSTSLNSPLPLADFQLVGEVDLPTTSARVKSPSPAGGNAQPVPPDLPLDAEKISGPVPTTNASENNNFDLIGMRQSLAQPAVPNVKVTQNEMLGNPIIIAKPFQAISTPTLKPRVPLSKAELSIALPQNESNGNSVLVAKPISSPAVSSPTKQSGNDESNVASPQREDIGKPVTIAAPSPTVPSQMSKQIGELSGVDSIAILPSGENTSNSVIAAVPSSTISSPSLKPAAPTGAVESFIVIQDNLPETTVPNTVLLSGVTRSFVDTNAIVDQMEKKPAQPSALKMNRAESIPASESVATLKSASNENILMPTAPATQSPEIFSSILTNALVTKVSGIRNSNISQSEYIGRRDTSAIPVNQADAKGRVVKGQEPEVQGTTHDETVMSQDQWPSESETGSGKNPIANDALQLQNLPLPLSSPSTPPPTLDTIKPVITEIAVHPLSEGNVDKTITAPETTSLAVPFTTEPADVIPAAVIQNEVATDAKDVISEPESSVDQGAVGMSPTQADVSIVASKTASSIPQMEIGQTFLNGSSPSTRFSSPRKVDLPTPFERVESASTLAVKAQGAVPALPVDDTTAILPQTLVKSTKQSDGSTSAGFVQPDIRTAELDMKVPQNESSGNPEVVAKPSPAVSSLAPKPALQLSEVESKAILAQNEGSDISDAGAKGLPAASSSSSKPTEESADGKSNVELTENVSSVNGILDPDVLSAMPSPILPGLPLATDRGNVVPNLISRTNHQGLPNSKVQSGADKIVAEANVNPDPVQKSMDQSPTPKLGRGENILSSEPDGSVPTSSKINLSAAKTVSAQKLEMLSPIPEGSISPKPPAISDRNATQSENPGPREVNAGAKGKVAKGEESDVQGTAKSGTVTVHEAVKTESETGSGKNPDMKEQFQVQEKIIETKPATTDSNPFQSPEDDTPTKTVNALSAPSNLDAKNAPIAATQADLLAKMTSQLSGIHNSQFTMPRQESNVRGSTATQEGQQGLIPGNLEQTIMDQVSKNLVLNLNSSSSEVRIAMKPASLGEVVMKVKMDDGKVSAQINVNNVSVKAVLDANVTQLREALLSKGIEVQHIDIVADGQTAFGSSSGQNNPKQKSQQGGTAGVDALGQYESLRTMGYNTIELIM
jgi:flagellar hook-length control protein FliK